MAMNLDFDTTGWEPIERPMPRLAPPLDLHPQKSPYYIGQLPTTANVNPDAVRNFATPGIPAYRITPAQPLNVAGSVVNAIAPATILPQVIQTVPAPTISSPLAATPTGYTFSFLQVRLPLSATNTINSYKIYRNTTNDSASATVIQSMPHHPANVGVPVVVQDAVTNGLIRFYFVSAINISGVESTLTPAQSGVVTNNAGFNANSQLASSFHSQPLNVSFSSNSATTLSNNGSSPNITVNASTAQFGAGLVSYNSATLAPGTFGTWFVTAQDLTGFQGGAVTYLVAPTNIFQTSADFLLPWGKIVTANASSTSGGGSTGGTSASSSAAISAVSGRGLTF
jgi:hypothetical protein